MSQSNRRFIVHSHDKNGDEWIFGTDAPDRADRHAVRFGEAGHTGIRIFDTKTGETTEYAKGAKVAATRVTGIGDRWPDRS